MIVLIVWKYVYKLVVNRVLLYNMFNCILNKVLIFCVVYKMLSVVMKSLVIKEK